MNRRSFVAKLGALAAIVVPWRARSQPVFEGTLVSAQGTFSGTVVPKRVATETINHPELAEHFGIPEHTITLRYQNDTGETIEGQWAASLCKMEWRQWSDSYGEVLDIPVSMDRGEHRAIGPGDTFEYTFDLTDLPAGEYWARIIRIHLPDLEIEVMESHEFSLLPLAEHRA